MTNRIIRFETQSIPPALDDLAVRIPEIEEFSFRFEPEPFSAEWLERRYIMALFGVGDIAPDDCTIKARRVLRCVLVADSEPGQDMRIKCALWACGASLSKCVGRCSLSLLAAMQSKGDPYREVAAMMLSRAAEGGRGGVGA